ncbi:hypothetical protein VCHC78A1_00276A, partial [Vibrio cholerae HC-78A1]
MLMLCSFCLVWC